MGKTTTSPGCENLDTQILQGDLDESLMDAIAKCLGEDVMRFARAKCGDGRGDVEDITQDALLAAQRYLKSFRGDASLRTWLYKLVTSACSHRRRGRKNDPGLHRPLEETMPLGAEKAADPELNLLVTERLDALKQAMEQLRPEDHELLASVEWEGMSLAQLSERTGHSVSALKSRLFRIRRQLRELVLAQFEAG
jgi:RNA polymerase sigma-70 factor (ECF subfamily)